MKKGPGVAAKAKGTRLKNGKALRVMTYPRPFTKRILVRIAKAQKVPLSNFMVVSAIERASKIWARPVKELIPANEYVELYGTSA